MSARFRATGRYSQRGFGLYEFADLYEQSCSLQESSLATEAAIWLGCDEGTHHLGECNARMHLDVKRARWLIERLQVFVETGRLDVPVPKVREKRGDAGPPSLESAEAR